MHHPVPEGLQPGHAAIGESEPAISKPLPPYYYEYFSSPLKVVQVPDTGAVRGYRLNVDTGRFSVENSALRRILVGHRGDDVFQIDEEEFICLTEQQRAKWLRGDGPIFAVYRVVADLVALHQHVDTPTWLVITEAITALRRRTFQLWDDEFARLDAGEAPTFHSEPVAGPDADGLTRKPDPTRDIEADRLGSFA